MAQFSTSEEVSLDKTIENIREIQPKTCPEKLDYIYDLDGCANWINTNAFTKVCLQFPDYLLPDAAQVSLKLQEKLHNNQQLFILADTVYESCCIDYVAAEHVNADAIIHFGPTCLSKSVTKIPYLLVFEKSPLNVEAPVSFQNYGLKFDGDEHEIWDVCYAYKFRDKNRPGFQTSTLNFLTNVDNPKKFKDKSLIFMGNSFSARKLPQLKLQYKPKRLLFCNGDTNICSEYENDKFLRRRNFLLECIKDSHTVGLIVGTLGVDNYLQVLGRLKILLKMHKKKYYVISVGKPTVAKLANFPEMDVFCVITCPLSDIYHDNRDFYKPIVTPFDLESALNPNQEDPLECDLDFSSFLHRKIGDLLSPQEGEGDVSLLTGKLRFKGEENPEIPGASIKDIALKTTGTVALNQGHGADFLNARTWKGLQPNLGQDDAEIAVEGRTGIAQSYTNEKCTK